MNVSKVVSDVRERLNLSPEDDVEIILANYHLQRLEWGEAVVYLKHGIENSSISDIEKANYLLNDTYKRLGIDGLESW